MAILLPTTTITTAAANVVGSVFQLREFPGAAQLPSGIVAQANFAWGSGGTTLAVYIQTSLDGGTTWCDVMSFAFTTAILRQVASVYSNKIAATDAVVTPTDASLAGGTVNDGTFGPLWRVKYTSTGTYAGGTAIRVDAFGNGLVPAFV